ncbi:hypothetical protein [Actinoplanes palleronii]|uniref:Bacterial repeat domain-containing protein n=1 Tax=Actinoplanes palleronii TaxID=113570 RepID=A0ABQ4BNM4_9ACTN|nr:hypothetical protein [Actinoplanes palleronii]GIE71815.1 hypothetical protein Apa02nite_079230 [Actinoplanes palleronii]
MNSIGYGDFRIDLIDGLGGRVERLRPEAGRPVPVTLARAGPAGAGLLEGRQRQLDQAWSAVAGNRPIEFAGPCGQGRTALLRHIAAGAGARLGRPGVYLTAGDDAPDDLLHRLVGEVYVVDRRVKQTAGTCTTLLERAEAVVVLDELTGDTDRVAAVLRVLPGCAVVIASDQPRLGGYGDSVVLPGLADTVAAAVLRHDLGRPLTAYESEAAARLIAAVHGRPLALRQAAALVRTYEQTLATLADRPGDLDRLSLGGLSSLQRGILAALALLAGVRLPGDLISAITGTGDVAEALVELRDRGFVEQRGDRFGLPVCKAEGYLGVLGDYVSAGSAAREIVDWLTTRDPGSEASLSAASAALSLLKFGAKRLGWDAVVQLIRVAEPVLALAGRWETCRRILNLGTRAGRAIGDQGAQAFFGHEQGTLALCQDRTEEARALLTEAARMRESIGDRAGAELSRHNLSLLTVPVVTVAAASAPGRPAPARRWEPRRMVSLAVATLGVLVLVAIGVNAAFKNGPDSAAVVTASPTAAPGRSPATPVLTTGPTRTTTTSAPAITSPTTTSPSSPASPTTSPTTVPPTNLSPRLAPSRTEFPGVDVTPGGPGTVQDFVVTNPNNVAVIMAAARVDGSGAYTVEADDCAGQEIVPQGQCQVRVAFSPTTIGRHIGTLLLADAGGRTAAARLSGTGFALLTVTFTGTGKGTVAGGEADCGASCSVRITKPGPLTLTAAPAPPGRDVTRFANWTGECSQFKNQPTCPLPMIRDTTVGAAFFLVSDGRAGVAEKPGG